MSLDVYLILEKPILKKETGIYARISGTTRELTIEEVRMRYPGSNIEEQEYETDEVFTANITHNLTEMANEAGIYKYLWKPEKLEITKAEELIEPLNQGLHRLKSEPKRYKYFNPSNGWGSYEELIRFVSNYLEACRQFPEAKIEISR